MGAKNAVRRLSSEWDRVENRPSAAESQILHNRSLLLELTLRQRGGY
jgi:hypothetical protein